MRTFRNLSHAAGVVLSIATAMAQPIPKTFGEQVFDALSTGELKAFDAFLPNQSEFAVAAMSLPADTTQGWPGLIGADVYERRTVIGQSLQALLEEGRSQGIRWSAIVWTGARESNPAMATTGPGKGTVQRCSLTVLFQHEGLLYEAAFPANINTGRGWRFADTAVSLRRAGDRLSSPERWVPIDHVEAPMDPVEPYDVADDVHLRVEVEVAPVYPGGDAAFDRQLAERIKWPPGAKSAQVTVSYVVEQDGRIHEGRIEQGASPELDAAVLEALGRMPPYTASAKENGVPVRIRTTRILQLQLP